ncbi:hypothetical protein MZO42_02755 [Sphingomonas psychrotolerans]|uniref:Uncharacterized protein n=1 Tax=Sphingomonas psychrotolerans TaxID=1327635 RepID=A0ABU3N1I2_9SPHN|nr:hypothetical protein [Sphingomonas psychrotolerans]MDT8757607.1 hypothetical protein [Sphingomonas psychrotolerans]
MSDPQDVSGVWYGRYSADHGYEDNGFIALIEEISGTVTGTITEPDEASRQIRRATVAGRRDGASLRFTKQYDGSGGWTHAVRYSGMVDADGTLVMGRWTVEGLTGAFDMTRKKFDAEALEDEEEAEIVIGRSA